MAGISEMLRRHMDLHQLSEAEVADQMGVSQPTVNRLLDGKNPRNAATRRGLLKVLGDTVRPLLPGDPIEDVDDQGDDAPMNNGAGRDDKTNCDQVLAENEQLKREIRASHAQLINAIQVISELKAERDRAVAGIGGPGNSSAVPIGTPLESGVAEGHSAA